MESVVQVVLSLIRALLPVISDSVLVQKIIDALIQIIPVLVDVYKDILPEIRNIIGVLKQSTAITDEQLDQLSAIEEQYDADFEAAATAALAEDAKQP